MNTYMIMAALILLLALLMRGELPQNKKYIIWACLIMFAVYGLRDTYSVGIDNTSSYLHQFQAMETTTWAELREETSLNENLFWKAIVKLGYTILGGDYQLFISVISAFVMIVFGRFIYRHSASPVQSFVYYWGLWFFTFNFSALKQSIAMSLLLLAFDAILDRKLIRYIAAVFFATMFHFPAIVFAPAYWLTKLNPRRGFLVFLAAAFGAVYLWRDEILNFVVQFYYENREFVGEDRFLTGKVTVMGLLVLTAYFLRPPSKENKAYAASMQFVAVATVIQLFSVYNNVFERLADYYFQFSVIFVPFIFDRRIRDKRKLEKTAIITVGPYILAALCLYRFNDIVTREATGLLPCKFFFQSEGVEQVRELCARIFL